MIIYNRRQPSINPFEIGRNIYNLLDGDILHKLRRVFESIWENLIKVIKLNFLLQVSFEQNSFDGAPVREVFLDAVAELIEHHLQSLHHETWRLGKSSKWFEFSRELNSSEVEVNLITLTFSFNFTFELLKVVFVTHKLILHRRSFLCTHIFQNGHVFLAHLHIADWRIVVKSSKGNGLVVRFLWRTLWRWNHLMH